MKTYMPNPLRVVLFLLTVFLILPQSLWAEENPWIAKGDQAIMDKKYSEAESHYLKALEADPESPRVLRALADVKFALKKYKEAKVIVDKILAELAPTTTFQLRSASEVAFKKLSQLVRKVPAFTLELGTDMAQIPQVIHDFLKEHRS